MSRSSPLRLSPCTWVSPGRPAAAAAAPRAILRSGGRSQHRPLPPAPGCPGHQPGLGTREGEPGLCEAPGLFSHGEGLQRGARTRRCSVCRGARACGRLCEPWSLCPREPGTGGDCCRKPRRAAVPCLGDPGWTRSIPVPGFVLSSVPAEGWRRWREGGPGLQPELRSPSLPAEPVPPLGDGQGEGRPQVWGDLPLRHPRADVGPALHPADLGQAEDAARPLRLAGLVPRR